MIYTKTNLISGLIKLVFEIVELVFKFLFKILKSLHLRLLFIICLAGALLEILYNKLSGDATYLIVFLTLAGFAFVRFIYLNLDKQIVTKINVKKTATKEKAVREQAEIPPQRTYEEKPQMPANVQKSVNKINKPLYYRVSQNPKYVMAEYDDRYELFYEGKDGLKYIRTDYKSSGENYD